MVKADTKQVGDANSARVLAVDALGALLRNGKNFDQAFNLDTRRKALSARDAAFARLMLLTTLRHLGDIDAALAANEVSYTQVRAMVRVATPENEEILLGWAK